MLLDKPFYFEIDLLFLEFSKTSDGTPSSRSSGGAENPGSTGHRLFTGLAVPDADDLTFHRFLSAEGARVFAVLRDLHLLDHLTERRAIPRAILSDDSHLLRAFGLKSKVKGQANGRSVVTTTALIRFVLLP